MFSSIDPNDSFIQSENGSCIIKALETFSAAARSIHDLKSKKGSTISKSQLTESFEIIQNTTSDFSVIDKSMSGTSDFSMLDKELGDLKLNYILDKEEDTYA